jgi:hypothetical protein
MFSGVRRVLTLPPGFSVVAEAVVRNVSTNFLMVLRSMSQYALRCYQSRYFLFMKNVSTAKARITADH